MEQQTLAEKLHSKKIKEPNGFMYWFFTQVIKILNKTDKAHFTYKAYPSFGMCTDITRFYTFVGGEFVEFFPDSRDVLRWDHLTEEMHRYCGGKWQNTNYRHYDSFGQGNEQFVD